MPIKNIMIQAPAKINWSLEISGVRADGYHLLNSLMQQIELFDQVELILSDQDSCSCAGVADEGNLALRAWLAIKKRLGLRECLEISIQKNIPIGAGLAGGSSDAAAVLRGANQLLSLGLDQPELMSIGLSLGADVPFCLEGGACLVQGIGEKLTPLPKIPSYWLLLANPGFSVATPQVYRSYDQVGSDAAPDIALLQKLLEQNSPEKASDVWGNQLFDAALQLHPQLKEIESAFASCGLSALMSGSGGTFFAVCGDEEQARQAAASLGQRLPWVKAVRTLRQNPSI